MIRRVLIPLDGSEIAESTIFRLGFLLRQSGASVTLLAVVDTRQAGWITHLAVSSSDIVVEMEKEAERYLTGVAERLAGTCDEVKVRVETGHTADKILEVASDEHSSVICMATHGRTGLSRWMYGSVTEKVVRASERPVLVVPAFDRSGEPKPDARQWSFESILVALDGSRQAVQIIDHVAEGVRLFGSRATLLLVLDDDADAKIVDLATQHLDGASRMFASSGVTVATDLRRGDPATEIVDHAPRSGHDMIAMTTHGRSGPSRWMLGSVAEKVLRRATVPVLVVRSTTDAPTADRDTS